MNSQKERNHLNKCKKDASDKIQYSLILYKLEMEGHIFKLTNNTYKNYIGETVNGFPMKG